MSSDDDSGGSWTLLTGHGHVLVEIARNPHARIRDISPVVGLTERTVQVIVADLEAAGYPSSDPVNLPGGQACLGGRWVRTTGRLHTLRCIDHTVRSEARISRCLRWPSGEAGSGAGGSWSLGNHLRLHWGGVPVRPMAWVLRLGAPAWMALGRSPRCRYGMPMTAHSSAAGWAAMVCSTSMLEIFSPPEMMMSLIRLAGVPLSPKSLINLRLIQRLYGTSKGAMSRAGRNAAELMCRQLWDDVAKEGEVRKGWYDAEARRGKLFPVDTASGRGACR